MGGAAFGLWSLLQAWVAHLGVRKAGGGGGEYGTCKTFVVRGIMLCVCALESLMDMNA